MKHRVRRVQCVNLFVGLAAQSVALLKHRVAKRTVAPAAGVGEQLKELTTAIRDVVQAVLLVHGGTLRGQGGQDVREERRAIHNDLGVAEEH